MGFRLSKIYTRTGDNGSTGLSNGQRVSKSDMRIVVIGDVDELNIAIGIVLAGGLDNSSRDILTSVQHHLFNLGGALSMPGHSLLDQLHIQWLENQLDALNQPLGPLQDFILPGGSMEAAHCHLARTVCRRAERSLVALNEQESVPSVLLQYLNRLSDMLFVLARHINHQKGCPDILWDNKAQPNV